MIIIELKKILIKQRALFIIIFFIGLKIFITLHNGYDSDYIVEQNTQGYDYYIQTFKGELTSKKMKDIEKEYYAVNHAKGQLEELSRSFAKGKINITEYYKQSKLNYERLKNMEVFNYIYNRYLKLKEEPGKRFLIDDRGWTTLLKEKLDFLLIICLVSIIAPFICIEFENGMNAILLSSRYGKFRSIVYKMFISGGIASILTLVFNIIEFAIVNSMVGIKDLNFPLKSIDMFYNSGYDISLERAYIMILLFRIIGAVFFAHCICALAVLTKKTLFNLCLGCVIIFIPYIIFKEKTVLYYLPLPAGMMEGTGYLWGASYIDSFNQNGDYVKAVNFNKIEFRSLIYLLIGYVIEIVMLFLFSIVVFSKQYFKIGGFINRQKLIKLLSVMVLIITFLPGCSNEKESKDIYTYNYNGYQNTGNTEKYSIKFKIDDGTITATDKKNRKSFLINRNPFKSKSQISGVLIRDNYCYYLEFENGKKGIRIYEINTKSFSEKLIYNGIDENSEDFYGIMTKSSNNVYLTNTLINCFFLNDKYIYYKRNTYLIRIDRQTGQESIIAMGLDNALSCSYHNGDIYFLDNQYSINVYKEKDQKTEKLNLYSERFELKDNKLVYEDLLDNDKIKSILVNNR